MTAEHKRSGKRHLIDDTGLATLCGKTLYRAKFRRTHKALRIKDCRRCMAVRKARR